MPEAATLVLLRHGESTWNASNQFTGWYDCPLSERGLQEAAEAGRQMAEAGLQPQVCHTSVLTRAIQTAHLALEAMGLLWLPVRRSWRLNERHPRHDPRYAELTPDLLPATECLKDVVGRMLPYWYDAIVPDLRAHRCVLVAAHGNSLRALVKHLDGISDEEIPELNIPTGIPRVYRLDANLRSLQAEYLGDPEEVAAKAAAVAAQAGAARP